ncbi:hypothetical protein F511_43730 [Dorcoceras hygrometricum]|uniref:Uncharacterized protein n=1 Tax=Dorcoceras hygrometricum TaxID=472368 RepID=A0A2Z7CN96_9LAMI|nr:hypothetical protein F511_43730 [Dorcoceras hygrometricum]
MKAIKDRIARLVYQLENHLNRASIPRTVYQPRKSSVRDHRSPSTHHSSVVFSTTPMIELDHSSTTTKSSGHNVALNQVMNQSVNQAQDVCMNAKNSYQIPTCIIYAKQSMKLIKFIKSASRKHFITQIIAMSTLKLLELLQFVPHSFNLPQQIPQRHGRTQPKQISFLLTSSTSAEAILYLKFKLPEEPKNTRFRSHEKLRTNRFFALLSNADSGLLASINRKSNSRGIQRHQSRSKQRLESTEISGRNVRVNSSYRGF